MKNIQSKMANNITFVAVVGSALISELIKLTFSEQDNLFMITVAVILLTIIGLNLYNFLYEKRVSKGEGPQSMAIKSSKLVNDYLKNLKKIIDDQTYSEKEALILEEVASISRPLLLLGEYKVRYLLGKKIAQNTDDLEIKMRYMMDEVGWTSVLMGKKRAVTEIEDAIALFPVEVVEKNQHLTLNFKHKSDADLRKLFLVVRGKRHLASTPFIEASKRWEISREALALMDYLETIDYIDNIIAKDKRDAMLAGIHYSMGEIQYAMALKVHQHKTTFLEFYEALSLGYKYTHLTIEKSRAFKNKHRYLKALLLENSIVNLLHESNKAFDFQNTIKDSKYGQMLALKTAKDIQENIDTIEQCLNSSIYVDEAFEVFLKQRIQLDGGTNEN